MNNSQGTSAFKSIFLPHKWENYAKRTDILSSNNQEDWNNIDFPVEVSAELTNYCNLKCIMCPVPALKRERGFMDKLVFKQLVENICNESGYIFLPQGFGEIFLHPKWFSFIDFACHNKVQPIVVLTNGMLLNKENIKRLLYTVDVIVVTIDGINPRTYESIRVNGSFRTVTKNIENFLNLRGNNIRPLLVLRIIRMKKTEREIEEFCKFWSNVIGRNDIVHVAPFNDWVGSVAYKGVEKKKTEKLRKPCRMLWKNLSVLHNGQVSPCCYDSEGKLIVGDVLKQTIKEIWNGSLLKNLRELHFTHQFEKVSLCSQCTDWF